MALERPYTRLACRRLGSQDLEGLKKSGWEAAHGAVEQDGRLVGVHVSGVCRKLETSRQNYYAQAAKTSGGGSRVGGGFGSAGAAVATAPGHAQGPLPAQGRAGPGGGADWPIPAFEVLRAEELLLTPLAAQYPRTTQSYHNLPLFRNQIKEMVEWRGTTQKALTITL